MYSYLAEYKLNYISIYLFSIAMKTYLPCIKVLLHGKTLENNSVHSELTL